VRRYFFPVLCHHSCYLNRKVLVGILAFHSHIFRFLHLLSLFRQSFRPNRKVSFTLALEFPSLATDESKLSPVDSLGNLKSAWIIPRALFFNTYLHRSFPLLCRALPLLRLNILNQTACNLKNLRE
jgi:hypothetical protein